MSENKDTEMDLFLEENDTEPGLTSFEKKYQTQMRQIITQRLDLPVSALPTMLKDQIKINPEFQRRDRWDESRQSRLIESLLMNVPIPPVFLGEDAYGFYVVLDGRQRLTAIRNFLNNILVLKGLQVWDDLNGMKYDDLVKRGIDKHLTRRFIPAVAILKESSSAVKYDVFDRLNTGGVQANDMEIRNAVFAGRFTDNLHKIARLPIFCQLWGIPVDMLDAEKNTLYQQMHDLTMVLRFFAFQNPENMEGPFRDYLSDFMSERNIEYQNDNSLEKRDLALFDSAARNCWKIFGEDSFRNMEKEKRGKKSAPIADAVMISLGGVEEDKITTEIANKIREEFEALFSNQEFTKSISAGTNGKGAILTRISMARNAVKKAMSSN